MISKCRLKSDNRVVLGTLNINILRNKLPSLIEIVSGNIDVFDIEETKTKIDSSFPEAQFFIPGYKNSFFKDRNANSLCQIRYPLQRVKLF